MVQLRGDELRFNEVMDLVIGLLLFCTGIGMADVDEDLPPSIVVFGVAKLIFGIKVEVDGPVAVDFVPWEEEEVTSFEEDEDGETIEADTWAGLTHVISIDLSCWRGEDLIKILDDGVVLVMVTFGLLSLLLLVVIFEGGFVLGSDPSRMVFNADGFCCGNREAIYCIQHGDYTTWSNALLYNSKLCFDFIF